MKVNDIGIEMARQNNRATQNPMFVVMTDKRVYMPHSYQRDYDGKERLDTDYQEVEESDLCDSCRAKYVAGGDYDDLPADCEDCHPDAFNWYKVEEQIEQMPGVFFTAKACQRHIDQNSYHYKNPRVYGIGSWRNPEMVVVQQHLLELAGKKVPSHYL